MVTGWSALRVKASLNVGHALIQNRSDDSFIIAHPRSGSTWLRTILANILRPDKPSNPDVFNKLIPGVSIRGALNVNRLPAPRIIMSHTWYRPDLPNVIYMVRDGRDVLVSFYHYTITRNRQSDRINFPEFFNLYYRGKYAYLWHHHVTSWLNEGRKTMGDHFLVIRFEDLREDTVAVVERVADFLGITATRKQVEVAIQQASLANLRKIERERWQKKGLGVPEKATTFYRSGKSGQWKDYFTENNFKLFYQKSAEALGLAGYDS
jgi:estrone sulfotransferase